MYVRCPTKHSRNGEERSWSGCCWRKREGPNRAYYGEDWFRKGIWGFPDVKNIWCFSPKRSYSEYFLKRVSSSCMESRDNNLKEWCRVDKKEGKPFKHWSDLEHGRRVTLWPLQVVLARYPIPEVLGTIWKPLLWLETTSHLGICSCMRHQASTSLPSCHCQPNGWIHTATTDNINNSNANFKPGKHMHFLTWSPWQLMKWDNCPHFTDEERSLERERETFSNVSCLEFESRQCTRSAFSRQFWGSGQTREILTCRFPCMTLF